MTWGAHISARPAPPPRVQPCVCFVRTLLILVASTQLGYVLNSESGRVEPPTAPGCSCTHAHPRAPTRTHAQYLDVVSNLLPIQKIRPRMTSPHLQSNPRGWILSSYLCPIFTRDSYPGISHKAKNLGLIRSRPPPLFSHVHGPCSVLAALFERALHHENPHLFVPFLHRQTPSSFAYFLLFQPFSLRPLTHNPTETRVPAASTSCS